MVSTGGSVRYGGKTYSSVQLAGLGPDWTTYMRGDFLQGRPFLQTEYDRSATVAVISADVAEEVFAGGDAVGATLRLQGVPYRVVGVFKPKPNLFDGGPQLCAYVPADVGVQDAGRSDAEWMEFWVVPAAGFTQEQAMDDVTATHAPDAQLRAGEENNFALVRQEAFADLVDRIIRAFAIVMLVLAGDRADRGRRGRGGRS